MMFFFLMFADFKHALVLEPQNKDAARAEQRVRKLMS
jgi:hypothetical protein